jgi:hypothetical protein
MNDLETMAHGLQALRNIEQHADQQGIPALTATACRDCMRAAAAILQRRPADEVNALFCAPMQQWRDQLTAAHHVADEVLG